MKEIRTNSDILKIVKQMDKYQEKLRSLYNQIENSEYTQKHELCENLYDNNIITYASAQDIFKNLF
jgi:hypothetical protein